MTCSPCYAHRPPCAFCDNVLSGKEDVELRIYPNGIVAFEDRLYPSTPGHVLIIPRRHVARVQDLTNLEWSALFRTLGCEMADRAADPSNPEPAGYTIGINDGAAAGQTVPHVHLHLIPRTHGDTADPRGGIRWAIPETAAYWQACR